MLKIQIFIRIRRILNKNSTYKLNRQIVHLWLFHLPTSKHDCKEDIGEAC